MILNQLIGLFMVASLSASSKTLIHLVPGESLGEVAIGETKKSLIAKGFKVNPDRSSDSGEYFQKYPLLVLTKDDKVSRVFLLAPQKHFARLRYHGKQFPKDSQLKDIAKVLGGCSEVERGSGGLFQVCSGGRVELATCSPSDAICSLCVKAAD
jgi:hypothetical protein